MTDTNMTWNQSIFISSRLIMGICKYFFCIDYDLDFKDFSVFVVFDMSLDDVNLIY